MSDHHEDHGHSKAAWTGVLIMLVASVVACLGVLLEQPVMLWGGLAAAVVGALVWYMLERKGSDDDARTEPATADHR